MTRHRSAVTGQFISAEEAAANPRETVSEEEADNAAELARLEAMLAASQGDGFKDRREAIEAKLKELRGEK